MQTRFFGSKKFNSSLAIVGLAMLALMLYTMIAPMGDYAAPLWISIMLMPLLMLSALVLFIGRWVHLRSIKRLEKQLRILEESD